jgi:hypothetical protein
MSPRSVFLLLVLVLVPLLLAAGCSGPEQRPAPGTAGIVTLQPAATASPSKSLFPPAGEVSVYKGFWMPCAFLSDTCQPMSDLRLLKGTGANIVAIGPTVKINSRGETRFDVPKEYVEIRMAELAKKYYAEGIRIHLVIEVNYEKEFLTGPTGEPRPIPPEIASQPQFLDNYNLVVADMAKLAEKYQVEIFSPMNEPDLKLGPVIASAWGQEILPTVKDAYHGKVLYKAAFLDQDMDQPRLDLRGYDAVGIDISPGGGDEQEVLRGYPDEVARKFATVSGWAAQDNVTEVMFTEFGTWGGAARFSEKGKATAHRIVFEQGNGKVKGFMVLDPPPDLDRPITSTKSLDVVTEWFARLSGG